VPFLRRVSASAPFDSQSDGLPTIVSISISRTGATIRRAAVPRVVFARIIPPSTDSRLVWSLVVSKQLQVDGIRQCVVSQVVWVPVVSAVVESTDLGRGSGIT
jgi:hypothetical protein